MQNYIVVIKGNDILEVKGIVKASSFKNACTLAEERMEALESQTIEQLRIVMVCEESYN